MYQSAVEHTLALYSHAIDAVDLTEHAVLEASRSWVRAAEATLPFPTDQAPWTLVDLGLDSASLYVAAQTRYAKSLLEWAAEALGAVASDTAPAPVEPALEAPPAAPKPVRRAAAKPPTQTSRPVPKSAPPGRPAAG